MNAPSRRRNRWILRRRPLRRRFPYPRLRRPVARRPASSVPAAALGRVPRAVTPEDCAEERAENSSGEWCAGRAGGERPPARERGGASGGAAGPETRSRAARSKRATVDACARGDSDRSSATSFDVVDAVIAQEQAVSTMMTERVTPTPSSFADEAPAPAESRASRDAAHPPPQSVGRQLRARRER